jgi:hypothetical protein
MEGMLTLPVPFLSVGSPSVESHEEGGFLTISSAANLQWVSAHGRGGNAYLSRFLRRWRGRRQRLKLEPVPDIPNKRRLQTSSPPSSPPGNDSSYSLPTRSCPPSSPAHRSDIFEDSKSSHGFQFPTPCFSSNSSASQGPRARILARSAAWRSFSLHPSQFWSSSSWSKCCYALGVAFPVKILCRGSVESYAFLVLGQTPGHGATGASGANVELDSGLALQVPLVLKEQTPLVAAAVGLVVEVAGASNFGVRRTEDGRMGLAGWRYWTGGHRELVMARRR